MEKNSTLNFFLFYTTFFGFVSWISALAGPTIFSNINVIKTMVPSSTIDFINPLYLGGVLWTMLSISSEFAAIYLLILLPFAITLMWIVACYARGVTP